MIILQDAGNPEGPGVLPLLPAAKLSAGLTALDKSHVAKAKVHISELEVLMSNWVKFEETKGIRPAPRGNGDKHTWPADVVASFEKGTRTPSYQCARTPGQP